MANTKRHIFIAVALLATVSGCKLSENTYTASEITIPNDFKGHADTISTGTIAFDKFFGDKTLVSLIDTALQYNADLLIAFQKVEAAKAGMLLHKGALYPSIDLNLSAGGTKYGKYTINGIGNAQSADIPGPVTPDYFVGLNSSWEIDVWGKLRNRKKAAKLRYLSTSAGKNFIATNLVAEVAYRYYALAALDEELDIIRKNIKLQEKALEIVKAQKEGGKATELAVKQFTAQLARTQAMEYKVKTDIAATENELNFLLGRYAQPIVRNSNTNPNIIGIAGVGVPSQLLLHRPDIVHAEMELKASKAEVAAARAAFLPSFTISAVAGYNAFNTTALFNPASLAYGFLGNLVGPVLNKNMIRANYMLMLAEHKGVYCQYGKTVMNAVYEVSTALESIEHLKSEYTLNEQAATALNEAVAISNDLYVAGYANYLEVITAQKNAIEAELEVVQTRKKILFSTINLYRALGGK